MASSEFSLYFKPSILSMSPELFLLAHIQLVQSIFYYTCICQVNPQKVSKVKIQYWYIRRASTVVFKYNFGHRKYSKILYTTEKTCNLMSKWPRIVRVRTHVNFIWLHVQYALNCCFPLPSFQICDQPPDSWRTCLLWSQAGQVRVQLRPQRVHEE